MRMSKAKNHYLDWISICSRHRVIPKISKSKIFHKFGQQFPRRSYARMTKMAAREL